MRKHNLAAFVASSIKIQEVRTRNTGRSTAIGSCFEKRLLSLTLLTRKLHVFLEYICSFQLLSVFGKASNPHKHSPIQRDQYAKNFPLNSHRYVDKFHKLTKVCNAL